MTAFELVFAAFGLVLGLAIAEVLGGFARVLKLRRCERAKVRIGALTPLLALFVLLDLTRFWLIAWNVRAAIPANYLTLVAVLAIVGTYYVVSTLIFPDDPEEWPDFDLHYDKHNRIVLGGMLAAQLALIALAAAVAAGAVTASGEGAELLNGRAGSGASGGPGWPTLLRAAAGLLPLPLLVALIAVKRRRVNAAFLCALIALNLADAAASAA
ncbi:MAG TPA: hypothetical protein VF552_11820 [Allosphingosinicella sp.]